jgi:hypothetical protein
MSDKLTKDSIDLSTLSIPRLFGRYFLPTLFGMLSISAMTAIDGIFVGHAVGADGIAAINICVPILMVVTGLALMMGAGCSVVASIHMAQHKLKAARINVTQAWIFAGHKAKHILAHQRQQSIRRTEHTSYCRREQHHQNGHSQYHDCGEYPSLCDIDAGCLELVLRHMD